MIACDLSNEGNEGDSGTRPGYPADCHSEDTTPPALLTRRRRHSAQRALQEFHPRCHDALAFRGITPGKETDATTTRIASCRL
jgi:hypothetical protein